MELPTKDVFEQHWSIKEGSANPENLTNDFYRYMVKTYREPFWVKEDYQVDDFEYAPLWCFNRLGQSKTVLADGTIIYIGGEYDDYYDPDFAIYNDVIVINSDQITIYGYPWNTFQPTDFHTASYIKKEKCIYIIGCIGYTKNDITPIYKLNLVDYSISKVISQGIHPGPIYDHRASYDEALNCILIDGGKINNSQINKHIYSLNLATLTWNLIQTDHDQLN